MSTLRIPYRLIDKVAAWQQYVLSNLRPGSIVRAGLVGGFGSGKTHALIDTALKLSRVNAHYYAERPTGIMTWANYPQVYDVGVVAWEECLRGITRLNRDFSWHIIGRHSLPEVHLPWGIILLRGRQKASTLEGENLAFAIDDELTLDPDEGAHLHSITSRIRLKEGRLAHLWGGRPYIGSWVREMLCEGDQADYHIRLATSDNPHLPSGYVDQLQARLPPYLVKAMVQGEWSEFVERAAFVCFSGDNIKADLPPDYSKDLYWSHDFNVGGNSSTIWQIRGNEVLQVDEIVMTGGTPLYQVVGEFVSKFNYPEFQGRIHILGDPAGAARSQQSARSNYRVLATELRRHFPADKVVEGWTSRIVPQRDSITDTNALFLNGAGERRAFISARCTKTIASIRETELTNEGKIAKNDKEHLSATVRYFVYLAAGGRFRTL